MSREQALEAAPADPLGRRWAMARRYGRSYLTWRGPDGDGGVQLIRRNYGVRSFRQLPVEPGGLCWQPITEIWTEIAPAGGRPAAPEG